jgi:hypothetical protein
MKTHLEQTQFITRMLALHDRWEKNRADTMAKSPPTGGQRGIFYPVFRQREFAAGYRYRTKTRNQSNIAKQGFSSSLRDEDNVILAIPTGMRQALRGV